MTDITQTLRTRDADRLRRYASHLAFYSGDQWPSVNRARARRLVFNYARAIIDKTASYLVTGLNFAVDPVDDTRCILSIGLDALDLLPSYVGHLRTDFELLEPADAAFHLRRMAHRMLAAIGER